MAEGAGFAIVDDDRASLRDELRRFELFDDLSDTELEPIVAASTRVAFEKKQSIFDDNDHADYLFLIQKGSVAIHITTIAPALEITISRLYPGEVLGEFALVGFDSRSAAATALEAAGAIRVAISELKSYFDANTSVGYRVMTRLAHIIADRVRKTNRRLLNIYRSSMY